MAEDSTRKLLKVFGVSMTECEDALAALTAALQDPREAGGGAAAALEAYGKAARELSARWGEVSRLILDCQTRAQLAMETYLRTRDGG